MWTLKPSPQNKILSAGKTYTNWKFLHAYFLTAQHPIA
jgi:hypothetical protein